MVNIEDHVQSGFGLNQLNAKQRFAAKDIERTHEICPDVCLRFRLAHLLDRYIYRHIVIRPLAEISFLVHCETVAQHRRGSDYFLPRFCDCPRIFMPLHFSMHRQIVLHTVRVLLPI